MANRYEQLFCTELKKWLKHNCKETCFIEAKIVMDNKPLNFKSGFQSHQLPTLISIREGSFDYKISDLDRMQKPFDQIHGYKTKTYVAIKWIRRGNKTFYLINPFTIQGLIDDGFKSLTESMAKEYADVVGELK